MPLFVRVILLILFGILGIVRVSAWHQSGQHGTVSSPLPYHMNPSPSPVAEPNCGGYPGVPSGVHCDNPQDFSGWPAPEELPPRYLCGEETHIDGNGQPVQLTVCRTNPAYPTEGV